MMLRELDPVTEFAIDSFEKLASRIPAEFKLYLHQARKRLEKAEQDCALLPRMMLTFWSSSAYKTWLIYGVAHSFLSPFLNGCFAVFMPIFGFLMLFLNPPEDLLMFGVWFLMTFGASGFFIQEYFRTVYAPAIETLNNYKLKSDQHDFFKAFFLEIAPLLDEEVMGYVESSFRSSPFRYWAEFEMQIQGKRYRLKCSHDHQMRSDRGGDSKLTLVHVFELFPLSSHYPPLSEKIQDFEAAQAQGTELREQETLMKNAICRFESLNIRYDGPHLAERVQSTLSEIASA